MDETESLRKCPGRDERRRLLAEFFERHGKRLRAVVRLRLDRRIQGRIDESDVVQDAFLEAARDLEGYLRSPKISLYLWLRFLTCRKLQELHRRHLGAKRRDARREISIFRGSIPQATSEELAAQLVGRTASPSEAAMRAELQLHVQEALDSMDPIDHEVLALRHFEELNSSEIAEVLGIEAGTARKRNIRALEKLKRLLGPAGLLDA
jgi:RNA polymerase sigma-70 factor (ECF subfamily)